jgi:hypothetical protein
MSTQQYCACVTRVMEGLHDVWDEFTAVESSHTISMKETTSDEFYEGYLSIFQDFFFTKCIKLTHKGYISLHTNFFHLQNYS